MQRETRERRQTLEAGLVDKAVKDAAFRRALTADPTGTLERELGVPLPAGFRLTVLEETPTHRYLVLPAAPTGQPGELSDQDLEAVAGGDATITAISTFCGQC
jgi:hypothetical protein